MSKFLTAERCAELEAEVDQLWAELAELRRLDKRATQGPWRVDRSVENWHCVVTSGGVNIEDTTIAEDLDLVVAMRNALPELLQQAKLALEWQKSALGGDVKAAMHLTKMLKENAELRAEVERLKEENAQLRSLSLDKLIIEGKNLGFYGDPEE